MRWRVQFGETARVMFENFVKIRRAAGVNPIWQGFQTSGVQLIPDHRSNIALLA